MNKNELYRVTKGKLSLELGRVKVFAIQVSEDIMLKAAYTAFDMTPEDLVALRDAYRKEFQEWRKNLAEDCRYDKDAWYASEVHERDMRLILGDHYEDFESRFQRPELQKLR